VVWNSSSQPKWSNSSLGIPINPSSSWWSLPACWLRAGDSLDNGSVQWPSFLFNGIRECDEIDRFLNSPLFQWLYDISFFIWLLFQNDDLHFSIIIKQYSNKYIFLRKIDFLYYLPPPEDKPTIIKPLLSFPSFPLLSFSIIESRFTAKLFLKRRKICFVLHPSLPKCWKLQHLTTIRT